MIITFLIIIFLQLGYICYMCILQVGQSMTFEMTKPLKIEIIEKVGWNMLSPTFYTEISETNYKSHMV